VIKKMKKKTLVLIGIAMCAILLTSPALASAGYSKIYGNANEDDVLDMRDVTYIKLVIFGKKPATTFADANNDGKISMLDIGQTKLIILGKEKKLTLVDQADRTVTVPRPIERVVAASNDGVIIPVQLGAADKIVGMNYGAHKYAKAYPSYYPLPDAAPELKDIPNVGTTSDLNMEVIVSLKPNVIFTRSYIADLPDKMQETTGIPVVCICTSQLDADIGVAYRVAGKVLGKEERAEELISYANEKIREVTEVTSEIPDSEKPKVYYVFAGSITRTTTGTDRLDMAGAINVAKDLPGFGPTVSKDQIILWNPDIIVIIGAIQPHSVSIEDVLSDPDLQTVDAVKNHRVYYMHFCPRTLDPAISISVGYYLAKLFHPDKFEDFDVEEESNEIFGRFYGVEGFYTKMLDWSDLYRWE
jgi:iron complex transport system substrate-binding protein